MKKAAIILAAGFGTRMSHVGVPKILLPIGIHPTITLWRKYLEAQPDLEVVRPIMVVNSQTKKALKGMNLLHEDFFHYVIDDTPRGTMATLQVALPHIKLDPPIAMVFNGDNLPLEFVPENVEIWSSCTMATSPYDQELSYEVVVECGFPKVIKRTDVRMNAGAYCFAGLTMMQALARTDITEIQDFVGDYAKTCNQVTLWKMKKPSIDVGNPIAYDVTQRDRWMDLYDLLGLEGGSHG